MSLPWRRLLFYFLLAFFVISAPLIILYTAGFRYNFKQNKILRTGAILAGTDPAGASILLNNRQRQEITPARLLNLSPGEYTLHLAKKDYFPWQKKLSVESNQVAFADNIALFKKSEPETIASGEIIDFIFDPRGKTIFFLKKEGNLYEIWRSESNSEPALVWRSSFSAPPQFIDWLKDDELMIKSGVYYLLNLKSGAQTLKNLEKTTNFAWDKILAVQSHNFLLGLSRNNLYSINPLSSATDLLETKIIDFYPFGGKFFFLQQDNNGAILKESEWTSTREIARLPSANYEFREILPPFISLYDKDNKKIILLSQNDSRKIIDAVGNNLCWLHTDTPSFLSFSDFEIWNNFPQTNKNELISRLSEEIESALCHPSNSAFILISKNSLRALELDTRDQQNAYPLVQLEKINLVKMDKTGDAIYFTGTKNQSPGLWKLQIR